MQLADPHFITRRDLLRGAAAGTITLAMGGHTKAQPSRHPNILFILADDLGYADVSCYGHPDLSTPNIDHLATQGMRFLQAYANSAVCTATRVALITGRYQYRLRVGLEEPLAGNPDVRLPPEHPTLPSLLKKAGYSSTLVGKWHLGALPKFGPLKSGYDHFYGFRGGAVDYFFHGNAGQDDLWDDDVPVHQAGYLTDLLGSRAVEVVNGYAKSRQPFMISLHFNAPHWPWEAPGDETESERLRKAGGGLMHFDGGSQKTYQRMIEAMDRQIGRVLHALAGPVTATTFLKEARWANETYQLARLEKLPADGLASFFRKAHLDRLALAGGGLVARPHTARPHHRSGRHQHGLGPHAAVCGGRWTGSRLSAGWHESFAHAYTERRINPAQTVLAVQSQCATGDAFRGLQVP